MRDDTYRRWARGDCCCCGGALVESVNDVPCEPIGEGVLVCGRCVENHHLQGPVVEAMLKSIALRDERYVDEAIEGAGPR